MSKSTRIMIVATILVLTAIPGIAQDELAGDRPDLTESALTVGHLRFQLETGFGLERMEQGLVEETVYFNPTLFRLGFGEDFELRLETASFTNLSIDVDGQAEDFTGFSPIAIGAKYNFVAGQDVGDITAGLLFMFELPSGTDEFETDDLGLAVKLLLEWELSDSIGFASNLGFENSYDDIGVNYYNFLATGVIGISLTDEIGAFFELAADSKEWSEGDSSLLFDSGLTWLVQDDLQLDVAIGTGLAGDFVPDVFMTAGLIYKY